MPNTMPIKGAVAGATGSPFFRVATSSVPNGNYLFTNVNFPGIETYIPGFMYVVPATGSCSYQVTTNNGTAWVSMFNSILAGTPACGPALLYVDSGSTVRIVVGTGSADIQFLCLGNF